MCQRSSFVVVVVIFLSIILIGHRSAEADQSATQPMAAQPIAAQPIAPQPIAAQPIPIAAQPIAPQPIAAQPIAPQPIPIAAPPIAAGEKEENKTNITSKYKEDVYYDQSLSKYLARVTKETTARDPFALRPDNSSAIHAEIEQEMEARNRNSLFLTVCLGLCGGVILILGLVLLVVYKVRQAKAHLEAAEYIFYKENMPLLGAQRLDAQSPTTTPATTTLATTTPASTPATTPATSPATTPATTPATATPATTPVSLSPATSPATSVATTTTAATATAAVFPSVSGNTVGGQRGSSVGGTPTTWTPLQGSSGPSSRVGFSPVVSPPLGPGWPAPMTPGSPAYGGPVPVSAPVPAFVPARPPVPVPVPVSAPVPVSVPVGSPGPVSVPVGPPGPAFVPVSAPLTPAISKEEKAKVGEDGGKPRTVPVSASAMQISSEAKKKEEELARSTSRHTVK